MTNENEVKVWVHVKGGQKLVLLSSLPEKVQPSFKHFHKKEKK